MSCTHISVHVILDPTNVFVSRNHPTCPDGGLPDFSIGSPGSGLTQCKLPEEYRQNSVDRATSAADKAKFAAAVLVGDLAE